MKRGFSKVHNSQVYPSLSCTPRFTVSSAIACLQKPAVPFTDFIYIYMKKVCGHIKTMQMSVVWNTGLQLAFWGLGL